MASVLVISWYSRIHVRWAEGLDGAWSMEHGALWFQVKNISHDRSVCMPYMDIYMVTFTINIPQISPSVSIYTIHGSYGYLYKFEMDENPMRWNILVWLKASAGAESCERQSNGTWKMLLGDCMEIFPTFVNSLSEEQRELRDLLTLAASRVADSFDVKPAAGYIVAYFSHPLFEEQISIQHFFKSIF